MELKDGILSKIICYILGKIINKKIGKEVSLDVDKLEVKTINNGSDVKIYISAGCVINKNDLIELITKNM